ncbi:amino acid adenylation domain-containing protein [Streptomyces canus]|uniref:amino acid adenylation domain-containing protein n=1 Tax=Streptomyces canus TaxID=58343 RepID=UPI002DD99AFC|nr:amino acid adenylation domain-containing protein [Streptomyces canus]WSD83001.1 amino acid adenylation domain-containing protein [Streptomyces canus]WSD91831.1 amino acid adenylation domain-containing protein [Streptomyces canus]
MSLSGLIDRHVHARPGATAVAHQGPDGAEASLSYDELSRAANRLAAHLRARGVQRGDRVVISLRPGPDLVTAFLAVVRSAAAYVAVDPSHPAELRRLIVRDSGARAVVTDAAASAQYAGLDAVTVALDTEAAQISRRPADLPDVVPSPEDAAYVCYTAGTTGVPKGVVVPHRAVLDLVQSTDYLRLTADDAVAQVAGPSSDAITFEIWSTLTAGARLVGLAKDTVGEPARFERAVAERGITVVFLTTTAFNRIARERPAAFAPLRAVLFGGEACDPHPVRQVFRSGPPERLLHMYGSTEATTFATWHEVAEPAEGERTVPIGRPVGATVAVVEAGDGTQAGPGGSGELLLGGPGLATGYLGREHLTARQFVEDRFTGSGGRLFRTGDLVRLREDGELEFVGRVGDRIRLRGFCVELGAVESALTAHPSVSEAVATVHEDAAGDRHLVAHVVPAKADPAPAGDKERINEWKEIHEAVHADAGSVPPGTDFRGLISSYDEQPLPVEHSREWRSATVRRVRELGQRRILEIGVGTGLLMAPLAAGAKCQEYWATDFSECVIDALRSQVRRDPRLRGKVRLGCRGADDTAGLPAGYFDTVVINSVVQYFPGLTHLRTVLERVLPLLAPGGSVFLGDLRNLDLARCLQTGVELAHREASAVDGERVRRAVDRRVAKETELLLAPALFTALAHELPQVRAVDVRVKRGVHRNELTGYRYDAVLGTAEPVADLSSAPRLTWGSTVRGTAGLEVHLRQRCPAAVRVTRLPNARVHGEHAAMRALDDAGTAGDTPAAQTPAPDLEEVCAAAERLGYRALPTWSAEDAAALDIILVDPARIPAGPVTGVHAAPAVRTGACANTPAAFDGTVDLDVVLRSHLRERLPSCMVPSTVLTYDTLPLNASGKIDRTALSVPGRTGSHPGHQPGTAVQEIVRDLFAEVIGLPRSAVDADCDFFRIGGHALTAARFLARVRQTLGVDASSHTLYRAPTPARFAASIGEGRVSATGPGPSGTHSAVFPLRLRGTLSEPALDQALRDLGQRHEALRNSRLGSAGTRLRALAADDHLLEFTLPADTVDLWSQLPLAQEFAHAYRARAAGQPPHWGTSVRDTPPRTVYGDRVTTPVPGSAPPHGQEAVSALSCELSARLHQRLVRCTADHGVTVFMVVHAALAALLSRLGAGPQITVAAPVPARDSDALRGAVGPYGRVLALSVDTADDPTFTELLRRVRASDLAAYRADDPPLALPGGVALTVLQEAAVEFAAAGLTVRPEPPRLPTHRAAWELTLVERQSPAGAPGGITVTTSFPQETVGEAVAATLTGQLLSVLEAALDAPGTALSLLRPTASGEGTADAGLQGTETGLPTELPTGLPTGLPAAARGGLVVAAG